ncbi:MAG: Uma2 family endonuclease [Thermaceae bacterium]|nr:Uma2 family endonuclease [Thermaceae bacterium]
MVHEVKFRVDQLDHFPDDGKRREVIRGRLYVSPAPSIHHQLIVKRLIVQTELYLQQNPLGEVLPGVGVIFSSFDGVIPDVVFVSKERLAFLEERRIYAAPDWVIEVLSPGNSAYDLETERVLYQQQGVKLYWIVDPERLEVLVYEGRSEEPTIHRCNAKLEVSLLLGLFFDVGELSKKSPR